MTKQYTKFVNKKDFISTIVSAAREFSSCAFSTMYDDTDVLPVNIADGVQLINFVSSKHQWSENTRKLFVQVFYHGEKRAPGSGIFAVYLLCHRICGKKLPAIEDFKFNARSCSSDEAFKEITTLLDSNIANFVVDVLKDVGIHGTINLNHTYKSIPVLETTSAHKFGVGIHHHLGLEKIRLDEAKIIVIDGAVESVGEIDNLLSDASQSSVPCLFVARKFSNDVLQTFLVNYKRGTLNVFPIVVNDSIENINLLGDMSIATGAKYISSENGEIINSLRLDDCATISKVVLTTKSISFDSKLEQLQAVRKRVKEIKKRIENASWDKGMSPEDIELVFSSRLNSMSSNSVKLWVPGDKNYVSYVDRNFKFAINYCSSFANTGKIAIDKSFQFEMPNKIPAAIFEAAMVISESTCRSIIEVGGCVEISRNG